MKESKSKARTQKKSFTILEDTLERIWDYVAKHPELRYFNDSVLITLLLEWALRIKPPSPKDLFQLFNEIKDLYRRSPICSFTLKLMEKEILERERGKP